jgi:ubiquinone/menaquinone biosynthesis C-methylase UbiE
MKEFFEKSYESHRDHHDVNYDEARLSTWRDKSTTDYWRHQRMYENLAPLIESSNDNSWLTVGDGRYGTDANYLSNNGANKVLATDIADTYLKIAKEHAYITDFQVENAEAMSFANSSFDYVLCKEAYHHFPRPMIALYEMLRVASKSVVLIEPQDQNALVPARFGFNTVVKWFKQVIKNNIKSLFGKELYYNHGNYESVGNYVYTISEREIEKVALGLNYEMVSFKSLNDYYLEGVEFEKKQEGAPLYTAIKSTIEKADRAMKKGYRPGGILIAMIHKTKPSIETMDKLNHLGFVNRALPRNPYL